jgi:hypothetical protein
MRKGAILSESGDDHYRGHMRTFHAFIIHRFLLCAGLLITGCVPTVVGGGDGSSVAYVAGELQADELLSIDTCWQATIQALESLELDIKEQEKDGLSAKAIAYGADDKKVTVRLRREDEDRTSLKIRVGLWGDQRFSTVVLEKIEQFATGRDGIGKTERIPAKLPESAGPAPAERSSLY